MKHWTDSKQGKRDYQQDRFLVKRVDGNWLFIVADGMGGHVNGDLAAEAVCAAFDTLDSTKYQDLLLAAKVADVKCKEAGDSRGSTLSGLVVEPLSWGGANLTVIQAGDSLIQRVTIERGLRPLVKMDNDPWGRLTDCIGFLQNPSWSKFRTSEGDLLILTTDGVHGAPIDMEKVVTDAIYDDKVDPAEALVNAAIEAGSTDNCTAIVIEV